jgi:L-ascorbate metabolism protein UlaG (beta-lactamase superfamily)
MNKKRLHAFFLMFPVFTLLACASVKMKQATPIPTPTVTSAPSHLGLDPIPEQVAFKGEPFLPFDLQGFVLYRNAQAKDHTLTWSVTSSAHLAASLAESVLSLSLASPDWYGSEKVAVSGCDEAGNCVGQEIVFTRLDEDASGYVRVVYVGNSGFLITAGGKKVLVDALISTSMPTYTPPQYVLDAFAEAIPPLDNVDVVLASHSHEDHFNAERVQAYMENNPHSVFISTTQATSQLSGLGERVIAVNPALSGGPVTVEANSVTVEAVYISHGAVPAGQQEVYNNGYIVTMGGMRFFFCGDIEGIDNMLAYNLSEMDIDLAFIVHFYLRDTGTVNLIKQGIGARYYFPIHYEFTDPAFSATAVRRALPEAIIFDSELQSWIMP